ncbi:serine hydrolase [Pseudozobellia thermophila]|uniref:Beta-lactamase enzyme family protein n=1 Tax=Pseudozobellia thermophila TaxID=192903 RepID=A0A1M6I118_9FLAO|nr:serine hydrolase [Pseudozobellia thermophila]SHJ28137.1 Beta-lactamase enzyme family protein [Pseudozobellia thermophila]
MTRSYLGLCLLVLFHCRAPGPSVSDPLEHVLRSPHPNIKRVTDHIEAHEVQIRFTQIDRTEEGVFFTDYDFQTDESKYFYPASTVKLPIAALALEKLNHIDSLDMNTRFYVEGDSVETTFAEAVSEVFAVSDNLANNRLFEFLGQDRINSGLARKGVGRVRIAHRLGDPSDDLATKPLIVYENDSTTSIFEGSINTAPKPLDLKGIKKGKGYYEDGELIDEAFDFSLKNYYPIATQHQVLKRILFPEKFAPEERFDLSADQRDYLLNAMQAVPRTAGYDPAIYHDSYVKFFMYGDTKENIPPTVKIYNKVGFAYGTLTDCAYIVDTENKVEFMITATILVNKNGIFNDNTYEYEQVGIPFLAELGRQLYHYEVGRTP